MQAFCGSDVGAPAGTGTGDPTEICGGYDPCTDRRAFRRAAQDHQKPHSIPQWCREDRASVLTGYDDLFAVVHGQQQPRADLRADGAHLAQMDKNRARGAEKAVPAQFLFQLG